MSSKKTPDYPSPEERQFQGSLRNKRFLLLPVSLLFILVMGSATYVQARLLIEDQTHTQLDANLTSLAREIDQWLTTKSIRLGLATQGSFQDSLELILRISDTSDRDFIIAREFVLEKLQSVSEAAGGVTFNDFMITTPDGIVVVASNPNWEGINISNSEYFDELYNTNSSFAAYAPEPISDNQLKIISSHPKLDSNGELKAMIFGISGDIYFQNILKQVTRFHPDASSYIITNRNKFIGTDPKTGYLTPLLPSTQQTNLLLSPKLIHSFGTEGREHEIITLTTFDGSVAISDFTWLPSLAAGLVVEIPQDVVFGPLNRLGPFTIVLTVTLGLLLGVFIWFATQRVVTPIAELTDVTVEFAKGNWDQRALVNRNDEIGRLSYAFNQMADDLARSYQSLEAQVSERTSDLESRTKQLEATAQIARETAAIRDLDELLSNSTHLISEHFNFYHVGIFLLDRVRRFAILQAANSKGGKQMLDRGHRLEVGKLGVVGYVASSGQPRIALDVGTDAFFFDNPDLPDTRSEMALPLKIQNRVIGVLDVQSTRQSAFSQSDVEVLQILADQISLAIENTRLLEQSENTLREIQGLYGEQVKEGWQQQLSNRSKTYYFDRVRVKTATDDQTNFGALSNVDHPQVFISNGKQVLAAPIVIRGQNLGTITLRREKDDPPWLQEDVNLLQDSIEQIAVALDNARLLDETKQRATYEQITREITSRVRETLDIETILKTAATEISNKLGLAALDIQLNAHTDLEDTTGRN